MSWLGLGLGEFGAQAGEASLLNEQRRMRQQQMATEAARTKIEESLLPLRMMEMQEIQERIKKAGQPQATWHNLPGGGIGYTMEEPGKPPGELHVVTPGSPEYVDYKVDEQGRMTAFNKQSGRVELVPTQEGIKFPIPAGARPQWMKTYDPRGDLRYATLEPDGTVKAWGSLVPETLAQESFVDPTTGNTYQIRVPTHKKISAPVMMTPDGQTSWANILSGKQPSGPARTLGGPPMPTTPEEALSPQAGPPPPQPEKAPPTRKPSGPLAQKDGIKPPKLPPMPAAGPGPGTAAIMGGPSPAGAAKPLGAYADEPRLIKTAKPEADALKIVRTIEQTGPILDRLMPIMEQGKWKQRGDMWTQAKDAAAMRGRSALYNLGIAPGEPWDTVLQLTSLLKVVMGVPYMRGMRNMIYLSQIQQHLPDPMKDTPFLMQQKIYQLIPILRETRQQNMIPIMPGRQAPSPYQEPEQ